MSCSNSYYIGPAAFLFDEKYVNLGTYKLPNNKQNFSNDYDIECDARAEEGPTEKYQYYGKIVGNSKGNTITGNAEENETIDGASGNDILFGRAGHDTLKGSDGDDTLDGGKGDDHLWGGKGSDILKGGKGTDELYGGKSYDLLFSGPLRGDQSDSLNGGSGTDTFFLGEVDSGNTNTAGINWANLGLSLAGDITDLAFTVLAPGSKLAKEVVPMVFDVFKERLSIKSSSNSTPPAESSYAQIKDFNPVEDVTIIPLQPNGDPNVFVSDDTNSASDISFKYSENNNTDIFATLQFDFSDVFEKDVTSDTKRVFTDNLVNNALIIDSNSASLGLDSSQLLNINSSDLEDLGSNKFLVLGAYSGREIEGTSNNNYLYGTNFGDVIYDYGLDSGGRVSQPDAEDRDQMYGFGGDDVFLPSAGNDIIKGGKGSDTVSYDLDIVNSGIHVDLSNNEDTVTNDGFDTQDDLYNIENIIATNLNDTITGNAKNNTFTSLGGNDVLDGGDGQDTAVFSGNYDDYTITANGSSFDVKGPDGTDNLENIEQFKFGDGSTYDVESEEVLKNIGEYGQVSINHEWETIELDQSYSNPVVIASDPTYNGSDPATVRIKNVENNSFELRLQEPKSEDGKHPFEEDVSYVVIEEGDWKLADDTRLSVGNYNSGKLTSQGFETVDLTGFDNKPTVLSQVQTYNGGDWVTTRTKNQTASDFKLAMQEEEARNGGGHYEENIGWLAIEQSTVNDADGDIVLQGGTTGAKFDETEDSFSFDDDDGGFSNEPALIAKLGSYNGWDSANVRLTEITESSFGALVREDTSLDSEVWHTNEQISYLALNDDSGFLSAVV